MYNNTQPSVQGNPSAHITVRKGRAKIYDKEKQPSKIFLQGDQEFEIELFNPTTTHQLATIEINGKLISNTGIALKPGQRIYLERYLDVAKKFKFDIYEVEAGNPSVEAAISNNGLIKILFYAEITTPKSKPRTYTGTTLGGTWNGSSSINSTIIGDGSITLNNLYSGTLDCTSTNTYWNNSTLTTNISDSYTTTTSNSTIDYSNYLAENLNKSIDYSNYLCENTDTPINYTDYLADLNITKDFIETPKEDVKVKETGRVEQGEVSSQAFDYIDMDFSIFANTTIEYQILPLSEKIVETKDLKNYCTECGRGLKPEFKFCPSCGTKS